MTSRSRALASEIFGLAMGPLLLITPPLSRAQTVVGTIPLAPSVHAVAVNPVTNKIYVAVCPSFRSSIAGSVAVIDGATNAAVIVQAGVCPTAVAVNTVTNKIYVANFGDISLTCGSCFNYGSITVIDGATNAATTFTDANAKFPQAVAVDSVTNKIYVANRGGMFGSSASVTVIDGATNSTTTVTDPNASGLDAVAIAVNSATNKIYVANRLDPTAAGNNPGNVTVIDGATNTTTTISDPNAISPNSVAVNSVTNKIYVANGGDYPSLNHGNITVIDGASNAITTVTDPNALAPQAVAVNQTTNKIYIANANDSALNGNGGVTIIDGATNAISFVSDPNGLLPNAVAVDSGNNTVYVTNQGCYQEDGCSNPGFVTVISGATNSVTTLIDPNTSHPAAVAVNAATSQTYVASPGNITVIDDGAKATSHVLLVKVVGNGSGTVTSNPAGVNCGTSCTASFATGTAIDLSASAASGSTFSGWTTPCTGAAACNAPMTSDVFVAAVFDVSPPPDFSLFPSSTSLTIRRGGQVTDVISIVPTVGLSFGNAIQLSCAATGPAPLPTCSLSPSSLTTGASPGSTTLTVTVPGPVKGGGLVASNKDELPSPMYAVLLPLPGLALIGIGLAGRRTKERIRQLWLSCLLIAMVVLLAGCGGGSNNQQIQPQNYIVTVTATSGTIQHTVQVAVTVQ